MLSTRSHSKGSRNNVFIAHSEVVSNYIFGWLVLFSLSVFSEGPISCTSGVLFDPFKRVFSYQVVGYFFVYISFQFLVLLCCGIGCNHV